MRPAREEYDLGKNIHGQPVRLVRERLAGQPESWTLERGAGNQLDNTVRVFGLTAQQLQTIGEIAGEAR